MSYNTETVISPEWPAFSRLWKIVAIILFLLLVILWFLQASPWSENGGVCAAQSPEPVAKNDKVTDTLAPFLALNCQSVVHIPAGTSYVDDGATAMDNVDGEAMVVATGEVDYNTPGEYVITYTATDKAGNTSSTIRTIIVGPKKIADNLPPVAKLYFENNSAEFPADIELSLAAVIAHLRRNSESAAVISGFHSASGSLEHNRELSKQRAVSVSQLLQEAGIDAERIVLEEPVETTGSGSEAEARRVEVSIR